MGGVAYVTMGSVAYVSEFDMHKISIIYRIDR